MESGTNLTIHEGHFDQGQQGMERITVSNEMKRCTASEVESALRTRSKSGHDAYVVSAAANGARPTVMQSGEHHGEEGKEERRGRGTRNEKVYASQSRAGA
ncbi:hypothetical protein N7539_006226 [Penicillium diatomitis]|uniref:Uncharacterized protein n=1 Tax=Penicillium diatomitis TaxID=2819901 RepID=A0A9W9X357_9EURO|nr:uncharacterized protein N7539_006226 [Penicillium diatomitis]KAJ5482780.1 hypothetical protein N7539_006226 [Penicillium diatomitis]